MNSSLVPRCLIVAALTCGLPLLPSLASAQGPALGDEGPAHVVRLEVDASRAGPFAVPPYEALFLGQLRSAFADADIELVGEAPAGAPTLRVEIVSASSDGPDMTLRFLWIADGADPSLVFPAVDCRTCLNEIMGAHAEARSPKLVAAAQAHFNALEEGSEGGEDTGAGEEGDDGDDGDDHGPGDPVDTPPIGPLGISGAVGLGVGLALTIAGAVEISKGQVPVPGTSYLDTSEDHRPRGGILVGVGSAVLVAGAVMLGVDLVHRRAANGDRAASAHLFPLLTPTTAGFGVVGQF